MPGYIPWRNVDLQLQSGRTLWLSTTRPDGRPHSVPLWYWWDGQRVYFAAAKDSQKAQNLAHQSWVVLHLDDGEDVVLMTGKAVLVTDAAERERVDAVYREKYVDPLTGSQATVLNARDFLYRVAITSVTAWRLGSAATRTDWTFENKT